MSQTNQVPILSYSLPTAVSEHYPAVHGGEGPQWTGASRAEQGGVSVGVKRLRYQGLGRLATPVQPSQADSNGWWCPGPEAEVQLRDTGPTEDLVMGLLICGLSRLNLALTGEVRAPTPITHHFAFPQLTRRYCRGFVGPGTPPGCRALDKAIPWLSSAAQLGQSHTVLSHQP